MLPALHRTVELRPPQKKVGPAGVCIYCWDPAIGVDELTDEQVIPDGLGGDLILRKASCHACAKAINEVERKVINNYFGMLRDAFGVESRKRRGSAYKTRMREFRMGTGLGDDADLIAAIEAGLSPHPSGPDMPFVIPFEVFPIAPVLTGELRRGDLSPKIYFSHPDDIDDRISKVTQDDGTAWAVKTVVGHYERFIAKIAHSFAVSKLGADGFVPFLGDVIRGASPWDIGHYVGCTKEWPLLDSVHVLLLAEKTGFFRSRANPMIVYERPVYTVRMKLFDLVRSPLYEVVVGLTPSAASTSPRLLNIQSVHSR